MGDHIDIVFDGAPGPEVGRFVEVENAKGASINFGEWVERSDGYWVLRILAPSASPTPPAGEFVLDDDALMKALYDADVGLPLFKALTVTRWKDGIDLQFPNYEYRLLARALPVRTFADGIKAATRACEEQRGSKENIVAPLTNAAYDEACRDCATAVRALTAPVDVGQHEGAIFPQVREALVSDACAAFERFRWECPGNISGSALAAFAHLDRALAALQAGRGGKES